MVRLQKMTAIVWALWCIRFASAAINIDVTHATAPAGESDFSPISDPTAYDPSMHRCPLKCADYGNMYSWTPYFSVRLVQESKEPMLMKMSPPGLSENPAVSNIIRTCSLSAASPAISRFSIAEVENPRRAKHLYLSSLDRALACISNGTKFTEEIHLGMSMNTGFGPGWNARNTSG
jgi:hypothetical protein